jgi:tetratricopeptide (TPR) repeat protein
MTTSSLYESEALLDRAEALKELGKWGEAEPLYKQALEKRKAALGEVDPSVARYTDLCGQACTANGKMSEAEEYFKKAVEVLEKAYYAGHGAIAPVLEHLAALYCMQDKLADAEPILKRALEINEKCLSGDHRDTLQGMYKLAVLYHRLKKNADAETLLNKGLKSLDTPLGPSEEFKYELALIKDEDGKPAEAQALYRDAMVGFEQRRNLPRLATCLENYAKCLRKDNKKEEADKIDSAAKQVREISRPLESRHHDIFTATLLRA